MIRSQVRHHGTSQSPDFEVPSFLDINFEDLANHIGTAPHVIADLDHTLRIPSGPVDHAISEHISAARDAGSIESFSIGTDNLAGRFAPGAKQLADRIYSPFFHGRKLVHKPHPAFFWRIIDEVQSPPQTVIMIGNDPYRDIYGANAVGMTSVLVPPLGSSILIEFARHHKEHRGRRIITAGRTALSELLNPISNLD